MTVPLAHRIEDARTRVRALFGGQYVVDSQHAKLVFVPHSYGHFFVLTIVWL